jgi:tetratricopeptide (TPR) repeat protein
LLAGAFGVFALQARNTAYAARNEAVEEKKRADVARADAVKEKNNAQVSEKRAVENEQVAKDETKKAEKAAKEAEDRRKEAQAATERAVLAQRIPDEQREAAAQQAERATRAEVGAQAATSQLNNDKSNINTLAERLIQVTSPQEAALWRNYYATALAEIGRSDLSQSESAKVMAVFPDNLNALTNHGYMSLIRFDPNQALKDFERVRELDPNYSLNYLNLAVTQANLRRYDEASDSITKAIEWYRPGYFDGVFDSEVSADIKDAANRRVIYADGNSFNAALYYERAAIEAFRGGKDFEVRLAEADRNAAATDPPIEGYLTALNWSWLQQRKEEKDYAAWTVQAYLWRKAGYNDWARYYYLKFQCAHEQFKDPRYLSLAEWTAKQLRTLPKAATHIDCSTPPPVQSHPRLKLLQADGLASIGQYREAVTLLTPAIERAPDNIELLLRRARYEYSAGYWSGYWREEEDQKKYYTAARDDFARLLKLVDQQTAYKPIVYLFWSFMGPSLGALTPDDIAKYSQQAIDLGPANAGALAQISDAIAATNPEKAIELLKRSLSLDPSADNYLKLAVLQNQTAHYQDALKSINVAIALSGDRIDLYREREKSEKGLGVSEVERQRHLAAGYATVGDAQLKQEKTGEAYASYVAASGVLLTVETADTTGAINIDKAVVSSKLNALLDKSREKISARILTIKEGEGKTREVTIDRGTDDGFNAGDEGTLWTIYSKTGDKERKVQKIGTSQVKSVSAASGVVMVTMDDPKDDKLVQVGDMVEIDARVPPLSNRSTLWRLARFHISFISEDGERIFSDYRTLYREEDPELVNRILTQMRTEITRQALRISDNEIMKTVIKNGRYKDKTLKQVLDNPTNEDLLAMLNEMMQYPATYYGKDMKLFRTFAAWVLDEPK